MADDFEAFAADPPHTVGPRVAIGNGRRIAFNREAFRALGCPSAVELLHSPSTNAIRIRPATDGSGAMQFLVFAVRTADWPHAVDAHRFLDHHNITDERTAHTATVVDGMLQIDFDGPD